MPPTFALRSPCLPLPADRMDLLLQFADLLMHLDAHLAVLVRDHGVWVYAILFAIVFCETGLVVTPFLPGDSLLFIAGALAAAGDMSATVLTASLIAAAVSGNTVNYWIGRYLGPKVFHWEDSRIFSRAALMKTHAFYELHGGKTIVISRFLPIIRTFAPFVAGIGSMPHGRFQLFNVFGAALWVISLVLAGHFFGNLPWVRDNLTLVILLIVGVSVLPAVIGYWQHRASR
jgi:membrane-associated protein